MTLIVLTSSAAGNDGTEISVHGDLDVAAGPELRRVMGALTSAEVRLDLAHVGFLDCAGVRTLLWADEHVRGRGGVLVIGRPPDPVLRLLRLLRFDRHLLIRPAGTAEANPAPPGD
ncbi:STAS domain-containing protein [Streptosporangium sp. CA-135522]|uniref:STAS domain-containing protein n=1 Tax=Streptosporangium sp. CA-135522 TaxID=3240072 RepID=UPI003D8EF50B